MQPPHPAPAARPPRPHPLRRRSGRGIPSRSLYHYGHRFYSPSLGRWVSRDPIGENGGSCLYLFIENNCQCIYDYLGLIDADVNLMKKGSREDLAFRAVPDPPRRSSAVVVFGHAGMEDRRDGEVGKFLNAAQLAVEVERVLGDKCVVWLYMCVAGNDVVGEPGSSVGARLASMLKIRTGREIKVAAPRVIIGVGEVGSKKEGTIDPQPPDGWIVFPQPPAAKKEKRR